MLGAAIKETPCRSQSVRFVVALAFEAMVTSAFIKVLAVGAVSLDTIKSKEVVCHIENHSCTQHSRRETGQLHASVAFTSEGSAYIAYGIGGWVRPRTRLDTSE